MFFHRILIPSLLIITCLLASSLANKSRHKPFIYVNSGLFEDVKASDQAHIRDYTRKRAKFR